MRAGTAEDVACLERKLPSNAVGVYAAHFALQQAGEAAFLIASEADRPLGVAMLLRTAVAPRATAAYPSVPHIAHLQVREDARGLGTGTALIEHAVELARAGGSAAVTISVTIDNDRAARLYSRLGFRRTNVLDEVAYLWTSSNGVGHDEREVQELLLKVLRPRSATRDEAVDAVARVAAARTGLTLIGIDGFGGAGKSTLAAAIAASVPGSVVVAVDDFAAPIIPEWDWERLRVQLLVPLLAGRTARYQAWDWHQNIGGEWLEVRPRGVVIVEGVSSTRVEVGAPWALTIWVRTPRELRLARAIERDGEGMRWNWEQVWMPSENAYAARERPQERVDLIVDGTSD
ncbi:MAG: GNAT family N-acetyltransferase [Jatrophihabitantaceae bacterium]